VLDEIGLSLGRHQPHLLDDLEDDYFDLIVTLAPEAHHVALDLTRSWSVDMSTTGRRPTRPLPRARASRYWTPIGTCATTFQGSSLARLAAQEWPGQLKNR
jgi:hypothetical protein